MSRSLHTTSFGLYSGHRVDFVPYERFLETCQLRLVLDAREAWGSAAVAVLQLLQTRAG